MSDIEDVRDWWKTDIIDVADGSIRYWGYPIEQLIGTVTFPQAVWLLVRGELPTPGQAKLLEAAMVASVNGGPMSPSCSIAAMAATCGVGLNGAVASGINALGDTHGGVGQQCMEIYAKIAKRMKSGVSMEQAVDEYLEGFFAGGGKFLPGFGHRFHHGADPRAVRLLDLVKKAEEEGVVTGESRRIALAIEAGLTKLKGKRLPLNVDGAFGALIAELGFEPPLGRGIFVLARAVGLMAHAWENMQEGRRIKGPVPKDVMYTYSGPAKRDVPPQE